jgi:hypothetical protein
LAETGCKPAAGSLAEFPLLRAKASQASRLGCAAADAFFGDFYDELIIVGPPGIGKSEHFRKRCKKHPKRCRYLEGNTKPLALYMECYWHIHKFLILDDAEGLWGSENGKHLMRQLTQHSIHKEVQWLSTVKDLERNGVPTRFSTSSKCAFLMNRFVASSNDHFYEAILDRGHVFYFDPPVLERHKYAATWFHDQEVHNFVGANLHMANDLTARTYNLLDQKKRAGHDWRNYFFDRFCHGSVLQVVQQLENDDAYNTVEERVRSQLSERVTADCAIYLPIMISAVSSPIRRRCDCSPRLRHGRVIAKR